MRLFQLSRINNLRHPLLGGVAIASALLGLGHGTAHAAAAGTINAIGVENEYADVIAQIGGRYVNAQAIESDPNTDPHTFEASPKIASEVASAELIVKNGIGYDSWVDKIIASAPQSQRQVIDVQHLLNLPDSTPNPHLWYDPKTMPAVAKAVADALGKLDPAHAKAFEANAAKFDASLKPWLAAIADFKSKHGGTPVATTEPVGDYMLQAAGCTLSTPESLETAVMNGTDPSPQDVTTQNNLFRNHAVKVFVYNQQVTDSLTNSFLTLAKQNNVPIVGVYETMPVPGYHYQSWMLAEVKALDKAVTEGTSTEKLVAGTNP